MAKTRADILRQIRRNRKRRAYVRAVDRVNEAVRKGLQFHKKEPSPDRMIGDVLRANPDQGPFTRAARRNAIERHHQRSVMEALRSARETRQVCERLGLQPETTIVDRVTRSLKRQA